MTQLVVARKIAEILARVARVRELLPKTPEVFSTKRTEAEALILNLYLGLQAASDLAMHVAADRGLGVPADARRAHELLGGVGIIPEDLSRRLAAAVGLRNRIAHSYGSLDLVLVFEAARDDLGDLEALAGAVAAAYAL